MDTSVRRERFLAVFSPPGSAGWPAVPGWACTSRLGALTLYASRPEMLAESEDGLVSLLLYGEVYDPSGPNAKTRLIEEYRKLGPDFIQSVNGSFALLIADREQDRVLAFTDRVNSRSIFASRWDGTVLLSNEIALHPLVRAELDAAAVAGYLANGNMLNDRTPYQQVRTLERASIHNINAGGITSEAYWEYAFPEGFYGRGTEVMKADFADVLIQAIQARVREDNLVSLSSGFDSTVILGVLGSSLNEPGVRTFSYFHGKVRPGSDEAIAAEMADMYDYPHELIPSFDGSLLQTLQRNASMGEAISNYCDEVDAWVSVGKTHGGPGVALFAGDECFGGFRDYEITSDREVLKAASIYPFKTLAWIEPYLGSDLYRRFCQETDSEIETLLAKADHFNEYRQKKDYLFLDHRIDQRVMPWRENFAGRYFEVQNPFLDNRVLDFMMDVPGELRRGKRLFKMMAQSMFPELFHLPRARSSSAASYWVEMLPKQRDELAALVRSTPSRLDSLIPPEVVLQILMDPRTVSSGNEPVHVFQKNLLRAARRVGRDRFKYHFPTSEEVIKVLKRLLLLRQRLAL